MRLLRALPTLGQGDRLSCAAGAEKPGRARCHSPWPVFSWGGGEPSILKGFEEASLWVTERRYWQNVHTNALRFSPAIAFLPQAQRGEINISLDSGTAETSQKVKGGTALPP